MSETTLNLKLNQSNKNCRHHGFWHNNKIHPKKKTKQNDFLN